MRISRIRLSDHLRPAACAAGLPDGSLYPPFGTADIVHEESDIPIVSWQSPSGTDACAEAITATRSEQPSPLYGMSSYCSQPGNRCTTHSRRGSASGSPDRRVRSTGTTASLHARAGEYCGRPSHVATYTTSDQAPYGTQSQETRNPLPTSSADSFLDSPPSEERRTDPGVAPTPLVPRAPFAPATPCRPHNGPAGHCRERHRRSGTIDDLPRAERCWTASAKSPRPEANPGRDASP